MTVKSRWLPLLVWSGIGLLAAGPLRAAPGGSAARASERLVVLEGFYNPL